MNLMTIFMNNFTYHYKDNFLNNIDDIRSIALNCNYNKSDLNTGWKGFRSNLIEANLIKDPILDEICEFLNLEKNNYTLSCFFHYSLEETKYECFPSFNQYKWHVDGCDVAGVIYLQPFPMNNCGTSIINKKGEKLEIDNVYNRILYYDANLLHAPNNLFGKDIDNSRMTISFFMTHISN